MKHKGTIVSAFEAKTHLSRLLYEVEKGKSVTITRRGKPVARLVPVDKEQETLRTEEIIKGFAEIRGRVKGLVDIRKYIEEGRNR